MMESGMKGPRCLYYLHFLDAWKAGNYSAAFENLHQYFDYAMQTRGRKAYHHALMNLAVLQADFGCYDEAVAAMLETVVIARENRDNQCLNFALNWLYHFGKAHPELLGQAQATNMLNVERGGLQYLRIKARECRMWSLCASTLHSEVQLGLSNGESVATALENLLKSGHLIVVRNLKQLMGSQMGMSSHLWTRLGVAALGMQYCEIFLISHARNGQFYDTLRSTCRLAHLMTGQGRYDEAMVMLDDFQCLDEDPLRSWKVNQYWRKYRGVLQLKRDLHRNDLDGADQLLTQLLQYSGGDADLDVNFEIDILHIDYLIRRTDFTAALAKVEKLDMGMRKGGGDIGQRVKLLNMKALLQDKCGRPQKGFSVAVRAASIAFRARLMPLLWDAMGALANILTSLSEFEASSQILIAIIPRALECRDCSMNAQLYSFLADAYMGMAGQAGRGSPRRKEHLINCMKYIKRSFMEYSAVEDIKGRREMIAKNVMIKKVFGKRKPSVKPLIPVR